MTVRQIWEGMLTELSKVNAPSMLLQDFNYFLNKAVYQYINKRYNIYDINQQTTDDLRVLKSNTVLVPTPVEKILSGVEASDWNVGDVNLLGATYEFYLPLDYLHMLNCICIYEVRERYKCYNEGDYVQFPAKRLTADSWSVIINDYYNRPLPQRPYYYIHNVNTSEDLPTNPIKRVNLLGRDSVGTDAATDYTNDGSYVTTYVTKYQLKDHPLPVEVESISPEYELSTFINNTPGVTILDTMEVKRSGTSTGQSNLPRTIDLKNFTNKSVVEREAGVRYGNSSSVRCEIRYGCDDRVFKLRAVSIDYIKTPQTIRLTQEQVDTTADTSQIMEFPDYICDQIINELTMLVMENTADPRLQTNTVVTQSIANPAQQQTQQPQPQVRG